MNDTSLPSRVAIVGGGRLGSALARALQQSSHPVVGPLGRDYTPWQIADAGLVLLCVPDREISNAAGIAAERAAQSSLIGHCSGASSLRALAPVELTRRFSLHPLMTVAHQSVPSLRGVGAAVSAASEPARRAVTALALSLGMEPFVIAEEDRVAYHASASIASNFLVVLETFAEQMAACAGLERAALGALVRQTVENWLEQGADALTGPVARGDEETVCAQRAAVAEHVPEMLELFDVLVDATRQLTVVRA